MNPETSVLDTITKLSSRERGRVVVAASHGGIYAGYCAAKGAVRGVIFNNAGIGREGAGVGSLPRLDEFGIPAAAACNMSCEIGNGADMHSNGVISHLNQAALALDCSIGMPVSDCAQRFCFAQHNRPAAWEASESRTVFRSDPHTPPVIGIDSLSLLEERDAGAIVITGSHGALLGGKPDNAVWVNVAGLIVNDAGVGKNKAGVRRLELLEAMGIPGAAVAASTAKIGDAQSIYEEGILSHVNRIARNRGVKIGDSTVRFANCIGAP